MGETWDSIKEYFNMWSERSWFRTFFRTQKAEGEIADGGWVIGDAKIGEQELYLISTDNNGTQYVPQDDCVNW